MFVAWEAPERSPKPYPIVLVHGGALQGTEWMDTPDGRPGWAQRLVEAGYAVFVVDRPGHGRSPYNPDVLGPMTPQFAYEEGETVFFPMKTADKHTQWPLDSQDASALDAFIAPFGPLPADIAAWQEMDADRLARLLDRIGPAVIMTHSASGSDGWLVADRRPNLVKAIVTIEPMGPAFANTQNIGELSWGLTAAPITYDPPRASPEEARTADPAALRIPALTDMPIVLVSGEVSPQAGYAPQIRDFLANAGATVDLLHLPDLGIHGNGHGLIYERNSDEALQPVLRWLDEHINLKAGAGVRLRPLPPSELNAQQRDLYDQIQTLTKGLDRGFTMARKDGAMLGPYNPMLHFPQFGSAAWGMNTALSQHTSLPKPVHELVILVTGARFSARYELYAHEFTAERVGLSAAKIAALASGARPDGLTVEEATAFDVAAALTRGAQLPESTYQAAVKAFGEAGTGELMFLIGFYCLISVLLNGFDVMVPGRDSDTD